MKKETDAADDSRSVTRYPGQVTERHGPVGEESRLLDLAFDAIFILDGAENRIVYWNDGAESLYGYSREEALGQVSRDLLKTRPMAGTDPYRETRATGRWEGLLIQTTKHGRELTVEGRWALDRDSGAILEINRDVTQRTAEESRFQLLVSSVEDYAIFMLDPEGHVRTWNEGAQKIKGWTADEIIGRHFSSFYPVEDLVSGKPDRALRTAAEEGRFEDEGWRVRKDGSRFWADVVITPLHDVSGRLTGFAKVTRDMTQKEMERQRLEELERSKSTFLNLAAHELRGPLTVIRGYLSLLREGELNDGEVVNRTVLPALEAKTEEMSQLVEQMVEAARLEEGSLRLRLERHDLVSLVERSVVDMRPLADLRHRIDLELPDREINVLVDRERIRIILGNLIGNAIKYSPAGGDVRVSVGVEGKLALVSVSDQGIGIPESVRAQLFTRFGRLERSETAHIPGTGLGLYLSRELARMHGGELTLAATGERGSTFTLTLPAS